MKLLYGSMYPDLLIKNFTKFKIETEPRLISIFKRSLNKKNVFVPYQMYSKNER